MTKTMVYVTTEYVTKDDMVRTYNQYDPGSMWDECRMTQEFTQLLPPSKLVCRPTLTY